MEDGKHKHNTILVFAIISILLALIAYTEATEPQIAYEVILNNTNLAPTIHPEIPGTGERVNATTYYANSSALDLHVFAHASTANQVAGTFVYINGTLVCARSGRPLAIPEVAYRGCDLTIPKYSYYRVDFTDYHHYEWREYPILSGRNGTISIIQGNQSSVFDEIKVNTISKNDTLTNNSIILNASQIKVTEQNSEFYISSWSGRNYIELLGDGGEDNSVFFNSASVDGTKYNTFLSQVYYDSEAGVLRNSIVLTSVDSNVSKTNSLILSPYDIQVLSLSGTGNAYVCVNATGYLYRSGVACV